MSQQNRTVISPTWIAPIKPGTPADSLLVDHCLIVADDQIEKILPKELASETYKDLPWIELPQHLVTPGFVNTHGHAAMTLLRGVADDREMMDWLTNWIWPIEGELVDEEFVYDGTRLAALEMIQSGTTCAADTYFFPEQAAQAFNDIGFRAQVALPVLQFGNAWATGEEEHIRRGLKFHDSVKNSVLITTAFAPHSPYSVTDAGFEKVRMYAEQLNLPIHLHLHETATEVEDAIAESGIRPIARLDKLGILNPNLQAVHVTQLREDEITLLATHGVQVAHCPESNMKLASGICPVDALREAGINVALGTDGAASNNDLDMLQEARSASMLSKIHTMDATSLNAADVLKMMTYDGARFLGLEDEIGSIEPGKKADLTSIDLSNLSYQPLYDPISQLIYTATGRDVANVWINGQHLLVNGQLDSAARTQVVQATSSWQAKITALLNRL